MADGRHLVFFVINNAQYIELQLPNLICLRKCTQYIAKLKTTTCRPATILNFYIANSFHLVAAIIAKSDTVRTGGGAASF